ncbi:hypothetical protein [Kitasatospora sp. P5_F3]
MAAAGTLTLATGVLAAGPAQASGSYQGCPSGAACIYAQDKGWNGGHPDLIFWDGVYNLSYQEGNHIVFNNQTDGWKVELREGWNGTGTVRVYVQPGEHDVENLSPINSVVLRPA